MLELDLADAKDWAAAKRGPLEFVHRTLQRWVRRAGGDAIPNEILQVGVAISDNLGDLDGYEGPDGELFLSIEAHSVHNIAFRWTSELLERTHPRLPVTLYRLIHEGAGRFLRVWDFLDAQEMLEMKWDGFDLDPEWAEAEKEYFAELPRPEEAVPAELGRKPLARATLARLLRKLAPTDRVAAIMGAALEAAEIAAAWDRRDIMDITLEAIGVADWELPHPGISFCLEWDDVYDGLLQEYGEDIFQAGMPLAPSAGLRIHPDDPDSVRRAHDLVVAVTKTLVATARMLQLLPRRDPSALSEVLVGVCG